MSDLVENGRSTAVKLMVGLVRGVHTGTENVSQVDDAEEIPQR